MDPIIEDIWRFVRGDTDPKVFETWVCTEPAIEDLLGNDLYLEVISASYRSEEAAKEVRVRLEAFLRSGAPMACECVALPDTAVVDMAHPGRAIEHIEDICRRGDPYWWLGLSKCMVCSSYWLFAQEERQNDLFLLRRLTTTQVNDILTDGSWPPDFDKYETLLRLGREAGHRVRFVDPLGDSSLDWTMADLARERPGVKLSELAVLLNLDMDTAAAVADKAIIVHGAVIDLERESW